MLQYAAIATVCVSLIASASGCGGGAGTGQAPPETPDARQSRSQKPQGPPVLIAPPPAYGNKIVMACGNDRALAN